MKPVPVIAVLLVALPGLAFAEALPLSGSYGNVQGCLYSMTGALPESDDFFLLTADSVTTAASYCEFKRVISISPEGFLVTAACTEEGTEEQEAPFEMEIALTGADAYTLRLDDGASWGPLALCK